MRGAGRGRGRGLVNEYGGHSQEVVRSASSHVRLAAAGGGVKLQAVETGQAFLLNSTSEFAGFCRNPTYKEYFRVSSSSMMAAWLPQR